MANLDQNRVGKHVNKCKFDHGNFVDGQMVFH